MNDNNPEILLLYFNFKGVGQIIRYLLTYLKIPFVDILLDEYQKQKLTLSPYILERLRSKVINKADLPAIIHNNEVIYELNQIMFYICMTYNREDLLGVDIYQKARVSEILQLYNLKLIHNIRFSSNLLDEVHRLQLEGFELLAYIDNKFDTFLRESGYVKQLTLLLSSQEHAKFILGNLTIIDFYYIESCKYTLSLYGNLDEKLASEGWAEKAFAYRINQMARGKKVKNLEVLRTMKKYQEFFYSQEFYGMSRMYLEAYGFFPKSLPKEHVLAMKKLQAVYFLDMYYKEINENK